LRAWIVVDLGFGDCGKGLLTDFLTRQSAAGVVVRYNGGAQAGHNVVAADGRHHTFAQFGSGTFVPGVKTFLSRHVAVHPGALLVEGEALEKLGVRDAFSRLRISERALVITPFHQAANRIREIARGAGRHGSCGVGVGEAVEDARADPVTAVLAGDLSDPPRLRRKALAVREQKQAQLWEIYRKCKPGEALAREWAILTREGVIDAWLAIAARVAGLGLAAPDDVLGRWLRQSDAAVFEGAQGVLLDAEAGFHPYTTWSDCSLANALEILRELTPDVQATRVGVLRSHAVRHGPGPLPSETGDLARIVREHNRENAWQGPVRYGWFDAVLARYALAAAGGVDLLAVTHMDLLPRLKAWTCCTGYQPQPGGGAATDLRSQRGLPLEERARLTQALCAARPVLETCPASVDAVCEKMADLIGQPVGIVASGPRAENVHFS
jgi:adenylosuccinate synthase